MASISLNPHQHTLKTSVSCEGVGLHSGAPITLTINPAPANSGIHFFRTDLDDQNGISAHIDNVVDTCLATTISNKGMVVSTTEHLMAALQGFGIDNATIDLDGAEVPIMDGSAGPFILLLEEAGLKRQTAMRRVLRITKKMSFNSGDSKITIVPYEGYKVSGKIQFDDSLIKTQSFSIDLSSERFAKEISRARTFGYVEQVEELWSQGLALGGNLSNVIAIHWDRNSILNEDGLRFNDEFIRHKVLDLIGDLALLGFPLLGHITATRCGHTQHLEFMKALVQATDSWEIVELENDSSGSVFHRVASSTKAFGKQIIPLMVSGGTHPQPRVATVPC